MKYSQMKMENNQKSVNKFISEQDYYILTKFENLAKNIGDALTSSFIGLY